jgi:hypothetical protein
MHAHKFDGNGVTVKRQEILQTARNIGAAGSAISVSLGQHGGGLSLRSSIIN